MSDPLELLERTTRSANDVVAGVKIDQLDDATPCTEWKVRDLLNHMVGTAQLFGSAAAGDKSDINPFQTPPDDVIGDDPATAYDKAAQSMVTSWRNRGLDGTVTLVRGEMPATGACMIAVCDHVLHAWDLAQATGQKFDIDDEVLEAAEEFTNENMGPEGRGPGKPFAEAVKAPDGASRIEKLAAFMGRQVK